jgi:peptidoglycan/LPS O-acetylase OafA/YrhL
VVATVTAEAHSPSFGHEPALDGLRAVAVMAVLVFHGDDGWLGGGFLGVSVFFTLSGFLITTLLVREHASTSAIDLRGFWSRRFRRLLPASWLTMVLVVVAAAVGLWDADQVRSLRGDVPWALAELVNWHFIAGGADYSGTSAAPSPLQHFWSLAVEQQFYLVLPLVVVACLAFGGRRALVVVLGLLAASSAVLNAHLAAESVQRAYYGTDTRAAELLLGALLAVLIADRARPGTRIGRVVAALVGSVALVVLGVLLVVARVPAAWLYPWGLLLTAVATAAVIVGLLQAGPLRALLSIGMLAALGRISYGVYLLHWPVFLWLTPDRTGLPQGPLFVLRVSVTFAAAATMYRVLERPIRYGGRLPAPVAARALPTVAAFLVVTTLVVTAGAPGPPDYLVPRDEEAVVLRSSREPGAKAPALPWTALPATEVPATDAEGAEVPSPEVPVPDATVEPGAPGEPPIPARQPSRVLLVGDSVAASLEDAIGDTLVALGVDYATAAAPGCGVVRGLPTDEEGRVSEMTRACDEAVPRRQVDAVTRTEPDLVVVMSSWEMTNRQVDGVWYGFGSSEADEMLKRLLRESVDRLASRGARVALVLMPDVVDGRVQAVGPAEVARGRHLNGLLQDVAGADPERVRTVSLQEVVCPGDPCPAVVEGRELRAKDGRHFDDPDSATWVAQRLVERLLAVGAGHG